MTVFESDDNILNMFTPYDNVYNIASIREIKELNIGHFIIGEAIFDGLKNSIFKMKEIINAART